MNKKNTDNLLDLAKKIVVGEISEEEIEVKLNNPIYLVQKIILSTNPYTGITRTLKQWYHNDLETVKDLLHTRYCLVSKNHPKYKIDMNDKEHCGFQITTKNAIIEYKVVLINKLRIANLD